MSDSNTYIMRKQRVGFNSHLKHYAAPSFGILFWHVKVYCLAFVLGLGNSEYLHIIYIIIICS